MPDHLLRSWWCGVARVGHIKIKRCCKKIEKAVEGLKILMFFGSNDRFFDEMIARNINRIDGIHGGLTLDGFRGFTGESLLPAIYPGLESLG